MKWMVQFQENKGRATTRALPAAPHPARPYYTTKRPARASCIVGAGEDVDVGMGPLWPPVLYLKCIAPCALGLCYVKRFKVDNDRFLRIADNHPL